ncbi:hypothetical protein CEXT_450061 [Caerostris extrusa]|uniref:Uncharacterized protein n=1 Tax=Caerostris extrusa TaxID=172846 RepID=A0AAV4XEB3_CAEEX|nr:hypothetical protein CEXT_450061 [Caerostris extrusa]
MQVAFTEILQSKGGAIKISEIYEGVYLRKFLESGLASPTGITIGSEQAHKEEKQMQKRRKTRIKCDAILIISNLFEFPLNKIYRKQKSCIHLTHFQGGCSIHSEKR